MNFKELSESQVCSECGGPAFTDLILAEKKDACYYKVKASAKVWPSAYASGRLVQCRKKGASNYGKSKNESLAEFAPAGSGGDMPPRGPKTPGRDPWGGDDSGEDPYSRPDPRHYSRSIDFFGRFEADHFDEEVFDEKTGIFKGYWFDREAKDGKIQIAYFKFDDPQQAARDFNDSPGMGWYYEPMDEGLMEQQLDEKCWDTHRQAGMKKKGDRMVPNCVPKESIEEEQMDLNKLKGKAQKQGAMDLSTLRAAAKTAKPASELDKDKKQQQKKGAMDLSTLRAAAKTAKPASELGEDFDPEYDDEAGMADNNLQTLERAVEGIDDLITAGDNLPEWCQEKIANAKSMLVAVWDYMRSEDDREEDPEDVAMYEAIDGMAHALAKKYNISLDEAWESFEALPDHVLYETAQFRLSVLNEDWQKVNKSDRTDGMSRKAVKAYRRENPGSKLKTAVTTKPSKLKKGGKAAKRRKSFCARMRGMKKSRASAKTKRNPNSPINKALRRWNC